MYGRDIGLRKIAETTTKHVQNINPKDGSMKISTLTAAIYLATMAPFGVSAQAVSAPAITRTETGMTAGVVRKLDNEQKKITLKHEAIENLGMPPMTMVFRFEKASIVDGVKVGDRVMFRAEQINGTFVVTAMNQVHAIYSPALQ